MAKPAEDKEDKNPNAKKQVELSPSAMIIASNVVMIIIVIISLAVMYLLLDSSINKKIEKLAPLNEEEMLDEEEEGTKEGVLLDLGEFVLNLADAQSRRYLKVGVAIELSKTREEIEASHAPQKSSGHGSEGISTDNTGAIIAEMERYKPTIRDAVISVLSSKTSDELSTPTGKEIAKEEILDMINTIFEGKREALRVSFGQFIIQ